MAGFEGALSTTAVLTPPKHDAIMDDRTRFNTKPLSGTNGVKIDALAHHWSDTGVAT